jgi:bacillolysin
MRSVLLFALVVLPSLLLNGQTKGFKTIQKNPSGTAKPTISFKQTNGQHALKSTSTPRYAATKLLSFAGSTGNDQPRVIRNGNVPVYIEKSTSPLKSATSVTHEESFFTFLEEIKAITNITNPRESFKISGIHTDNLGITHIKAYQQYKGIEIYGSESTLHLDVQKERFTGSFHMISPDVATTPKIGVTQGLQTTVNDLQQHTVYRELSAKERKILHYDSPAYSLVIFDKGDKDYSLTWAITIRPNFIQEWKYFIDATTGEIIHKFNNTNSDGPATASAVDLNNVTRTIDTYLDNGTYYLYNSSEAMYNPTTDEGVIITLDANNTSTSNLNYSYITSANNTWTQKAAVSAHYNATLAYEYFSAAFGRNSINGQGGNILSLVNVTEDDGSSMENAFWNGQAVFYGNGGDYFKPLAGALDVAAHELGHGVISNSANLEYYGQSGAMNESFADIFGSMVDRNDWLIGEEVVKAAYYPSGALRNMANPHNGGASTNNYWQPAHVSEMYLGDQDNGGVHINSGIGNYAYYLFATAVGKDKAEQVYYRALTEYLTKTSQFIDLRIAVIQSAGDLYGSGSQEVVKAGEAFDAVGIQEEVPVEDTPDYNTNPGQEYLLSYDTNPSDPATLYRSSVAGSNFGVLSSTEMKGKVSVTDDGSAAVFVSTDNKIRVITPDPADPAEDFLSDEAFFDNVAVSKDGNRLAAISTEIDTSIYVYDFSTQVWHQFVLYNPTTSESNADAGGVLYADAIEFDITGEYLIYDAYNELNSSSSAAISYWDVGFIKVWDNAADDFGDGTISKLFTSLPENVSIGNPVFSKNSPFIIAFDYFYNDGVTEEYGIYGSNLETGDLELITANATLGYPSFSKNDDKIAYSAINTSDEEVVATIGLSADKITPSDAASILIPDAKWPVYYATGGRALGLAPVANFTADYKTGGAPLHVNYLDLSSNEPTLWLWTFQGGTPSSSTLQNPEVAYNSTGTYRVTLKATNSTGNNTITKEGYIVVSDATGINNPENKPALFYPNPVIDMLTIVYDKNFSVKIYNLQGELLLTGENKPQLDLSIMKPGIYIMELETETGITKHKLLKQ